MKKIITTASGEITISEYPFNTYINIEHKPHVEIYYIDSDGKNVALQ